MRRFETGGGAKIDFRRGGCRFLGRGEIEIVVFPAAEVGQRFFLAHFEDFDVAFFLQRCQRFLQRWHGVIGFLGNHCHIRLAVNGFQNLHQVARQRLLFLIDLGDAFGGFGKDCFEIHRVTLF